MFKLKRTKLEKKHQLKQHTKCKVDIVYFAEHYVNISTTDRGIHKIELYDFQKRVLNEFVNKEFSRNSILLAGRQATTTTLVAIYILWYSLFHEDKSIAVLRKRQSYANNINGIIRTAYDQLPDWLKPGIKGDKTRTEFGTGCVILYIKSHESNLALRGQFISLLYREEHEDPITKEDQDFFYSVIPTLLSSATAEVIFTSYKSTDVYRKALAGDNTFKPIKINWWEIPGRSESWKRDMIKHIGRDGFNKEFECLTTTQT
jgi:hypothetical protein